MKPLYELSADLAAELDDAFDPETGEALPVFEEKRGMWANKARSVVAYMLNRGSQHYLFGLTIEHVGDH